MSEHGTHDSLVWNALVRMPVPVEQRARQQLTEYLARVSAQQDRARVAPSYRRSPAEQFEAEAERLTRLGDPTVPVWRALAESARLEEQVRAMEPDDAEY